MAFSLTTLQLTTFSVSHLPATIHKATSIFLMQVSLSDAGVKQLAQEIFATDGALVSMLPLTLSYFLTR
jgi:hypothetical protein